MLCGSWSLDKITKLREKLHYRLSEIAMFVVEKHRQRHRSIDLIQAYDFLFVFYMPTLYRFQVTASSFSKVANFSAVYAFGALIWSDPIGISTKPFESNWKPITRRYLHDDFIYTYVFSCSDITPASNRETETDRQTDSRPHHKLR